MIRRQLIVASLASVALASCQCNSLRIEGDVSNLPDGPISLSTLDTTLHWSPIATTDVKGGHFIFTGSSLDDEECVILTQGDQNFVVFAGNGNVKIKGNALRPEDIVVSGSDINDKLIEFTNGVPGRERLSQIMALLGSTTNNVDRQEELTDEAREIKKAQAAYIRESIMSNSTSALGPFILLNHFGLLTYDEVQSFNETFRASIGDHKYVRLIDAELTKHRLAYEAQKRTEIGRPAPEIALPNAAGDTLSLRDLRGKIVLIEFWTSGDETCRKNNVTIAETYNKFADKGFTVLGISTDKDAAEWRKAVEAEDLKGVQLIDQAGQTADAYGVKALPVSFLIDEDGIIVAKDTEGDNIFADIEARMKKHAKAKN